MAVYEEPGIIQQVLWVLLPASVLGLIIGIGVFAGMYLAVNLALKRWAYDVHGSSETRDALEIVWERYARGEISRREYEQMREDLSMKGEGTAHRT